MSPDMHVAVRSFADVATVAALVVVVDLADTAIRAAHPSLLVADPPSCPSQRRALSLLRSLHRLRRDATRYLEHHADLVGHVPPPVHQRQLDMF